MTSQQRQMLHANDPRTLQKIKKNNEIIHIMKDNDMCHETIIQRQVSSKQKVKEEKLIN